MRTAVSEGNRLLRETRGVIKEAKKELLEPAVGLLQEIYDEESGEDDGDEDEGDGEEIREIKLKKKPVRRGRKALPDEDDE